MPVGVVAVLGGEADAKFPEMLRIGVVSSAPWTIGRGSGEKVKVMNPDAAEPLDRCVRFVVGQLMKPRQASAGHPS